MELNARWKTSIEASLIMFLCAAGLSCVEVSKRGPERSAYFALLTVPASAALIFVCLGLIFPDLIGSSGFRFPFNLTLPLSYCALLPVNSVLIATPEKGLVASGDSLSYARLWQQPRELMVTLLIEVVALSICSLMVKVQGPPDAS